MRSGPGVEGRSAPGLTRAAPRRAALARFTVGFGLSAVGQSMSTVAILVVVHERTDSVAWVGLAAAARLLPYLLVSPLAGALADRVDRRRLFIGSLLGRSVLAATLAAAVALHSGTAALILLSFAFTACGTPCFPVALASLPHLTSSRDLDRPTAMIGMVETAAYLAAPALGGAVLVATSSTVVLLVDAAVLATATLFIPRRLGRSAPSGETDAESLLDGLAGGVRLVADQPPLRASVLSVVILSVMNGVLSVLVVPMATDQLGTDSAGTGLLVAALGMGALLGAGLAAWRTTWSAAACLAMAGGPLALAAPTSRAGVLIALLVVVGAAAALFEVMMITRVRELTPEHLVARVFGLFDAAVVGAEVAGALAAPLVLGLAGLGATLVTAGVAVPVLALSALRRVRGASLRSAA
jgi:MFS family permease